jgi:hypothetical protein
MAPSFLQPVGQAAHNRLADFELAERMAAAVRHKRPYRNIVEHSGDLVEIRSVEILIDSSHDPLKVG